MVPTGTVDLIFLKKENIDPTYTSLFKISNCFTNYSISDLCYIKIFFFFMFWAWIIHFPLQSIWILIEGTEGIFSHYYFSIYNIYISLSFFLNLHLSFLCTCFAQHTKHSGILEYSCTQNNDKILMSYTIFTGLLK